MLSANKGREKKILLFGHFVFADWENRERDSLGRLGCEMFPEAYTFVGMLGLFRERIKIYFLISWNYW